MTLSTAYNGRWYRIVGTAGEVAGELNRVNAEPENCVFAGNDTGDITIFVGRH